MKYLWMDDHEALAQRNGARSSSYSQHQSNNNSLLSPTSAAKHLRRHSTISHKMIVIIFIKSSFRSIFKLLSISFRLIFL